MTHIFNFKFGRWALLLLLGTLSAGCFHTYSASPSEGEAQTVVDMQAQAAMSNGPSRTDRKKSHATIADNKEWRELVLQAIGLFPDKGGYYTGGKPNKQFATTTWQGLNNAYQMGTRDRRPRFDPVKAQPSFCSSATYAVLIKALLMWDDKHGQRISRQAWVNMKPYVGIADELNPSGLSQGDGVGFWGCCNANGPGIGVLVAELNAGESFTAFRGAKTAEFKETPDEPYLTDEQWAAHPIWQLAKPGDMMKIFWNRNESRGHDGGAIIGDDGVDGHRQEAGHSVVFLGIDKDGEVHYWSSNGPGEHPETMGYGRAHCPTADIQRVVFTRITHPERFDNARNMGPNSVNRYLRDLNGHLHSTTQQMLKALKINK